MINSKILLSVVIVLLIGVAAAGYQVSTQSTGFWSPVQSQTPDSSQSNPSTGTSTASGQSSSSGVSTSSSGQSSGSGGSVSVKISSSEAKALAQKAIKQPGATAGTPKLITSNGQKMYLVPVIMTGKQVGEIYIDPQTGANLGGAGGAP